MYKRYFYKKIGISFFLKSLYVKNKFLPFQRRKNVISQLILIFGANFKVICHLCVKKKRYLLNIILLNRFIRVGNSIFQKL